MITSDELSLWLRTARPGAWITYHTGPHLFGLQGVKRPAAEMALRLAELGEIFICQRRTETGDFEYRAMRLDEKMSKRVKSWHMK